ncbi:MAG: hypothetical protein Q7J84_12245, partial [Sulfuricaulis sp.]|nr:hypothetical protein [Sulfuricaulis sp.]
MKTKFDSFLHRIPVLLCGLIMGYLLTAPQAQAAALKPLAQPQTSEDEEANDLLDEDTQDQEDNTAQSIPPPVQAPAVPPSGKVMTPPHEPLGDSAPVSLPKPAAPLAPPPAAAKPPTPPQPPAAPPADGAASLRPGEMLFNFQEADIQAVVKTVSQITGRNFLMDPRVKGK